MENLEEVLRHRKQMLKGWYPHPYLVQNIPNIKK